MPFVKLCLVPAVLALSASAVMAQEGAGFTELSATRVGPEQVEISLTFDGGACQEVQDAELGEAVDGSLDVTFPSESTAEMCTMQIVPIEVQQTIEADETVSHLAVTVLGTDGEVQVSGETDVVEGTEGGESAAN